MQGIDDDGRAVKWADVNFKVAWNDAYFAWIPWMWDPRSPADHVEDGEPSLAFLGMESDVDANHAPRDEARREIPRLIYFNPAFLAQMKWDGEAMWTNTGPERLAALIDGDNRRGVHRYLRDALERGLRNVDVESTMDMLKHAVDATLAHEVGTPVDVDACSAVRRATC